MSRQKTAPEWEYLRQVTVRLLQPEERERFDALLESEHYLHSARVGGQSLRYVAEVEGQWVALLVFSGAAPHTKARECKIGWTPRQRARRLCLVVNNSRFLVLPERQRYPNLASRVLALALKRLNADWQEQWGHPVVLVESYVDESQYRGTCYRACGFEAVGLTAGYGRSSRDYYFGARPAQAALFAGTASARPGHSAPGTAAGRLWPSTRRKSAGPARCGPLTWARCWKSLNSSRTSGAAMV